MPDDGPKKRQPLQHLNELHTKKGDELMIQEETPTPLPFKFARVKGKRVKKFVFKGVEKIKLT